MKYFSLLFTLFIICSCSLEDAEKQLKDLIGNGDDKSDSELITVLETDNPDDVEVIDGANSSSDFVIDEDLDNFSINQENQFSGGPLDLAKIIELRKRGEHLIIAQSPEPQALKEKFYQALSCYTVAKSDRVDATTRRKMIIKADKLLRNVGVQASEDDLKIKSILWHGINSFKFNVYGRNSEKTLKPFKYIQENYSDSRYFNDSLLYTGLVYANRKDYSSAKRYLNLLNESDPDDKVWDINYIKWVTPQAATRHYSDLIKNTGQNFDNKKSDDEDAKKGRKNKKNLAKPIEIDEIPKNNEVVGSVSLDQFENQKVNGDLLSSYSDTFEESSKQELKKNSIKPETNKKNESLTTENYLKKNNHKENSDNLFDSTDLSDLSDL